MEMRVIWTDTARFQLEDIFNYYRNNASLQVAQKMVNQIFERTTQLEKFPYSGANESLLSKDIFEYRYLVEGNYKIIYWIENQLVNIATIFDCRQNPTKLKV